MHLIRKNLPKDQKHITKSTNVIINEEALTEEQIECFKKWMHEKANTLEFNYPQVVGNTKFAIKIGDDLIFRFDEERQKKRR